MTDAPTPTATPLPTDVSSKDMLNQSLVLPEAGACFHCGESLPKTPFTTVVLGSARQMCCLGCQLAASSIVEAGLEQYYLDRQKISRLASLPDALTLDVYNHEEIKSQFTYQEDAYTVAELSVAGLRCAACTWLIESRLNKIDGIKRCQVNLTQQRMRVIWDDEKTTIASILKAVNAIGYDAKPYRTDSHEAMLKRQNRQMLIRLGVAAVGAMQAMMFSIGIYFGDYSGMADEHREFLRWVSMIVSVPVLFYAGQPFFYSAWSALRVRQVNMDVPVSLALLITFFASSYATIIQRGETYFDSVAMFVFFLLAGRFVEHSARLKASTMASDLVVVAPKLVHKLGSDAALLAQLQAADALSDRCAVIDAWYQSGMAHSKNSKRSSENLIHKVQVGDVVRVDAGAEIIGDGILLSEAAAVSQSLLTGESDLVAKYRGDRLLGGTQNDAQPLIMLVTSEAKDSQLALIDRLINRAMSEKPKIAVDADRMARWFVARVLVLSVMVFGVWWWFDSNQAIWATVAVLVATCPCALSLATPMALTVATNRLASERLLVTRGHTIATLAEVTHVALDKTGTLTTGQATLIATDVVGDKQSPDLAEYYLTIAAALESGSRHPIAESFRRHSQRLHVPMATQVTHFAGGGVSGEIVGQSYRVGHLRFVLDVDDVMLHPDGKQGADMTAHQANMAVALSCWTGERYQLLAWFYFNDALRTDSKDFVTALKTCGVSVVMLTGDPSVAAVQLGQRLQIETYAGLLPEDKVNHIKHIQADDGRVLMVGDGVNDAPVLAAADVSVAMASASDLAQVSADGVLLSETLSVIVDAMILARKTKTIIRQNLRWALIYNSMMLIPAALGYVPPWLAAIGMSLSSLLVVMNALRLKRD